MSEGAPGGTENPEQTKEVAKEDDLLSQPSENVEKRIQGNETIAVVKSKIREKNAEQPERDVVKLSSSKLSKITKFKRGKLVPTEDLEATDSLVGEAKLDAALTEQISNAENLSLVASKKSLKKSKSVKSNRIPEEESQEQKSEEISELKQTLADESQSTFVISHDVETQNEVTKSASNISQTQNQGELSRRSTVQRQVTNERGNYLNNVTPAPIEEYNPEGDDDKDKQT